MQDEDRQAIQRNFISLVEQTDLDEMVSALYEKGVFSEQMIEPFKDTNKDTRTRKRQLYTALPRRGPEAFGHLLEALEEKGYWNLVRELDPASSLHLHLQQPRSTYNNQDSKGGEGNYVSIKTEREKTKPKVESSKNEIQSHPGDSGDMDTTHPSVEIPYFHVVKSKQFYDDTIDEDIKVYSTRRRRRRIFVIFNYTKFRANIEKDRKGVDIDYNKLRYLFHEMGFSVTAYQNLTKEMTKKTLEGLRKVLEGAECVFIVVSSHGYERGSDIEIRCEDGALISFLDIIEYFSNAKMPELRGVPKVFILQLCRGINKDWVTLPQISKRAGVPGAGASGVAAGAARVGAGGAPVETDGSPVESDRSPGESDGSPVETDGSPVESNAAQVETNGARWGEQRESQIVRLYSDILIAHSTIPGFVSHRDPDRGSWYIQALCEVFAARAHDCDVEKLFTLVDERMRAQFHLQTSSVEKWAFNRRLYLYPGLYED